MDIADLGFKVDTKSLKEGDAALDKFGKSAKQSSGETKKFTTAEQKATRATDQLKASLNGGSKTFSFLKGAILGAAGAFGAYLVASASIRKFVDNTIEAQRVQSQLKAALESTNGASGQTIKSLNDQAAALQKVSNYGDEVVNSAQSILLTFTGIAGDTFPRATRAVIDLSERMGTDLKSAAIQLGKALNDPAVGMSMLTRSGITFSEAQKEVVKKLVETNKLAEAQAVILNEVEKEFGGSARAARETLGGALTSLANAWGDLFEMSGGASEMLRSAIENLITAIQNPAFINFVQMIGVGLFGAMEVAVNAMSILAQAIPPIVDLLLHLSPLMIVAFGPAVATMVQTLAIAIGGTLMTAVQGLFLLLAANPLTAIAAAVVVILGYFVDWEKSINNLIKVWALFLYYWNSFWGDSAGQRYAIEIGLNADKAVEQLKSTGEELKQNLLGGFNDGGTSSAGKIKNALDQGGDSVAGKIKGSMQQGFTEQQASGIWESLNGQVIKPLGDTLVSGGKFIHNEVTGAVTKVGQTVGDDISSAGDGLGSSMTSAGEKAGSAMKKGIESGAASGSAQIFSTIESAFATLAPLSEVFLQFRLKAQSERAKTLAETNKLITETRKINSDIENRNRSTSTSGTLSGGSGSTTGGVAGGVAFDGMTASKLMEKGQFFGIPGFASGGEFTVPGRGGVDSQPVSFMATPGERVRVDHQGGSDKPQKIDLKVINVMDPKNQLAALNTAEGQKVFRNLITSNREEIAAILGVY